MTRRTLALALAAGAAAGAAELFRDDFSRFPPRILSEPVKGLTNAIHEYHFLAHRGVPLDRWANAMIHDNSWCGGDEDGQPYVEMHIPNAEASNFNPTLIVGDAEWADYSVELKMRPLLLEEMAGLVFRYHTNRHHYLFSRRSKRRCAPTSGATWRRRNSARIYAPIRNPEYNESNYRASISLPAGRDVK